MTEQNTQFKDAYAKFDKGGPLTDKELDYLIKELTDLEEKMDALGRDHVLSTRAIRQDLQTLKGFEFHRKHC
jgi:mRNA-degrading endonuclease YafQ of YafQ-DinJ toxin-antitoxin module